MVRAHVVVLVRHLCPAAITLRAGRVRSESSDRAVIRLGKNLKFASALVNCLGKGEQFAAPRLSACA
mgnify:CR=1 FL=1